MAENKTPELKPCPFCGTRPSALIRKNSELIDVFEIRCDAQPCMFIPHITVRLENKEQAVQAWNTRVDLAAPDTLSLAVEIVNWLFTNGAGDEADRLVMLKGNDRDGHSRSPNRNLGGWSKEAVTLFIARILAEHWPVDANRQARRETPEVVAERIVSDFIAYDQDAGQLREAIVAALRAEGKAKDDENKQEV